MELLSSKQDIGESLAAVDVLWQQYEKLESKTQSIYDNLTQLRMMVDKLCDNNHFASTDMRQFVTKLTNRYTFFEARLRERGNILRLSMAFHRHLEKRRQDCDFCQAEVMPFDDTMAAQDQQMDNLRESGG
ncbi:SEC14 domain and spectrin repeat-containing protein 1-B-like isoform X3 [Dysidea avara]|uniref:SEC14 domain and spectrin repeat-containing protein 1-B-like isoform X3 n=1 Tax=Dysidea avara TaxID=196820 RepID=UPI003318000A